MALPSPSNTPRPRSQGFHALIDDLYVRLIPEATDEPIIRTAPLQPPRVDTTTSPEEVRPESGVVFARSDFSGGAGLDFVHRADAHSPHNRFWDSKGIDITRPDPGEPSSIRLSRTMETIRTSSALTIGKTDDRTIWRALTATNVEFTINPLAATPSWTAEDPFAGEAGSEIYDLVTLGNVVYVALGSHGVHRRASGTWSHWSDLDVEGGGFWAVKGRILGVTPAQNGLYEAGSGATSTLLHTPPSGTTWAGVTETSTAILAAMEDGTILVFREESGSLVLKARASLPKERIRSIAAFGDVVLIGTTHYITSSKAFARLWRAKFNSEHNALTDVTLLYEWGDETTYMEISKEIGVTQNAAYFTITRWEAGGETHLWRYDFVTGGVSNHRTVNTVPVTMIGFTSVGDRLFVETANLYRETTTFTSTGYIISPLADFFTNADKIWHSLRTDLNDLTGDEKVTVHYSTDPAAISDPNHSSWIEVQSRIAGQVNHPSFFGGVSSRYITIKVTLTADTTANTSPEFRSFSVHAFPQPEEVIATLPINVSDHIERPHKSRIRVNGYGERIYNAVKQLEGKSVLLKILGGNDVIRGQVTSISHRRPIVTPRGSQTMLCMVVVRGTRTSINEVSLTAGPLATYRLLGKLPTLADVQ